jgi:hypothetical protein
MNMKVSQPAAAPERSSASGRPPVLARPVGAEDWQPPALRPAGRRLPSEDSAGYFGSPSRRHISSVGPAWFIV